MASIFTFDPDPPRVASPWSLSAQHSPRLDDEARIAQQSQEALTEDFEELNLTPREDLHVTRLQAEPQEGPTEYKLHLLLRPRRAFLAAHTTRHNASSPPSRPAPPSSSVASDSDRVASLSQTHGSRQHRLEQLTTQLLWRLQQSSPHHSSSATHVILPQLLDSAPTLVASSEPGKLVPGLEESKGALYEIGISDDGHFVGLAKDEMIESLGNLRAMAFALGCSVEVLRMVPVGECEWIDEEVTAADDGQVHRGRLYVAEAYVKPELRTRDASRKGRGADACQHKKERRSRTLPAADHVSTEQVRVSITGATTSGKSTLLGSLSTSSLDNGRGSSRLSLLKHRHEIASGMTSSLSQELIGYKDVSASPTCKIVNYGTADVVSWNDIHAEAHRLALLTDSAGHPRFRRTTVRGLVGWAPHWTLLCVAANGGTDGDLASVVSDPSFSGASAHLSMAHLDLCLRLELPLAVIVTKLDAANKTNFRQILSALLSMLKAAGRKPVILGNDNRSLADEELGAVPTKDEAEAKKLCSTLRDAPHASVPILFTSSVSGQGISKLHALLRHLPITSPRKLSESVRSESPPTVFHIDDTFVLPASAAAGLEGANEGNAPGSIVSGYLGRGSISVGDELLVGPFSQTVNVHVPHATPHSHHDDPFLTPRSFGEALMEVTSSQKHRVLPREKEWRRVKVVSVRNLRLPVHTLQEDQAGTLGLVPLDASAEDMSTDIRKGMVVTTEQPRGAHTFTALFQLEDAGSVTVGNIVVVYCASIRESARVIAVALQASESSARHGRDDGTDSEDGGAFAFDMDADAPEEHPEAREESVLVTLQFTSYRAWLDVGAAVLVMPTGAGPILSGADVSLKSFAGFDGYVGRVVETFG